MSFMTDDDDQTSVSGSAADDDRQFSAYPGLALMFKPKPTNPPFLAARRAHVDDVQVCIPWNASSSIVCVVPVAFFFILHSQDTTTRRARNYTRSLDKARTRRFLVIFIRHFTFTTALNWLWYTNNWLLWYTNHKQQKKHGLHGLVAL